MQLYIRLSILVSTLLLVLTACGGGSGEDANIGIQQGFGPNDTSSHALQTAAIYINRQAIRTVNPGTFVHAVSYADFDLDGDIDVFMSSGDGSMNPTPSELYLNDGAGNFTLDTSFFNGSPPGQVHPRKALTGDYNSDGKMDMFVIGHGYDMPPFPGEAPYVILSSPGGYFLGSGLDSFIGFQHGGASADIDNDNDIDVFVTDTTQPFFLVNDGFGNFTRDVAKIPDLGGGGIYTAELVDVDKDGFVDLLVSGHEYQGFSSQVLWGDNTGVWNVTRSTLLPQVADRGVVIDIDVADIDMDGHRDIFLTRTGDGQGPLAFYQGFQIQVLINQGGRTFLDKSIERLPSGISDAEDWIDWIRIQDFNGDSFKDIVVDDAARNIVWLNDGVGYFQRK